MSTLSTHVLDTRIGRPAHGVPIRLEACDEGPEAPFRLLGQQVTDTDGRVKNLLPPEEPLAPGLYRLTFETGAYFQAQKLEAFYPVVVVTFRILAPNEHYHVPLLLSPYGFSTYRGS